MPVCSETDVTCIRLHIIWQREVGTIIRHIGLVTMGIGSSYLSIPSNNPKRTRWISGRLSIGALIDKWSINTLVSRSVWYAQSYWSLIGRSWRVKKLIIYWVAWGEGITGETIWERNMWLMWCINCKGRIRRTNDLICAEERIVG